ncbi:MAG: glycosyltransferase [Candidatus Micrarchaeia archaeon]
MPSKKPLVSVLMPFYDNGSVENRKNFSEALSSILSQTFRDFEVVMVASGEKKFASNQARRSGKIRLFFFEQKAIPGKSLPLREKLYGIISARNLCVSKARGELLAFADYDDISLPIRLETEVGFLRSHPDIGAVGSSSIIIDEEGREIGRRAVFEDDAEIRRRMLQFNPVPQPTLMARAKLVREAGCYRQGEIPEDFDLWVRMAKITKFHNLREPLVKYRVHSGGGASNYAVELFFGSLRVKWRAAKTLGLRPGLRDIAVNFFQFLSLFFPNFLRRTVLEKIRSGVVIGNRA